MLQKGFLLADSAPPDAVRVSARPAILFMIASVLKEVVASERSFYRKSRAEQVTARRRLSIYIRRSGYKWGKATLGTPGSVDRKGLTGEVKHQARHDKQARVVYTSMTLKGSSDVTR